MTAVLLQTWLRDRKLSKSALARELELHPSVVNRVCNGRRQPTANFILRFFLRYGQPETIAVFGDDAHITQFTDKEDTHADDSPASAQ